MREKILKLNAYGRVIKGKFPETLICIKDSRKESTGHFILFKDLITRKPLFLDWVKNYSELKDYFESRDWEISWE